jgi:hypothetical protein
MEILACYDGKVNMKRIRIPQNLALEPIQIIDFEQVLRFLVPLSP